VFSSWQQAVEAFGEINVSLSGRLDNIICLEFADKVRLVLSKHQQQAIATVDRLAFAEWLGREVFWESQQGQGGESLSQERARQGREEKVRLRQNAERDPHVQALIKEMDAQLVKVLPAGVEEQAGDER
jgi:DNA polymerase-3 subunit gamma/tau